MGSCLCVAGVHAVGGCNFECGHAERAAGFGPQPSAGAHAWKQVHFNLLCQYTILKQAQMQNAFPLILSYGTKQCWNVCHAADEAEVALTQAAGLACKAETC